MLATQTLTTDTVTALTAAFPDLEVSLYPSNPAGYRLNHPTGALLVGYIGSSSASPMLMGRVEQVRTLRISVTLVTRQLWGDDGAAALLDRIRTAMIGWRPAECEPVYAISDRFVQEDAGLWWYAAEFALNTRLILPIHA